MTNTAADDNIFALLGFDPVEAEDLRARAGLMIELRRLVHGLEIAAAAMRLGVGRRQAKDLVRGRIDHFTVDALVRMRDATDDR